MHVYLTGFMGVGKTTVGRILAQLMERPFIDLDETIEARQSATIREIFQSVGESGFRELEAAVLRELDAAPAVVALGGGVQARRENREWLATHGTTVWLDLALEDLMTRLRDEERARRPLLKSEAQIRQLYRVRREGYSDSDLRIEVLSSDSAEVVALRIRDRMEQKQCAT
jgi:shikimate kinase